MELRLDDKVAIVTGASRGIGLAIAQSYAEAGARVMLASRKQEGLDAALEEFDPDARKQVASCVAHVGDPDAIDGLMQRTLDEFGSIDVLVNNAATNPYMGRTIEIDLPRHDKTWEVNFRGQLVATQRAYEASMKDNGGVVIFMSSVGGLSVEPAIGIYNATKAALIHLTRTLAAELAPDVRVNAIAPGLVKTQLARALWEPAEDAIAAVTPLKRLGTPEDIANAALYLASDAAAWITGQTLVVDGGAMLGFQRG